MFCAVALAAPTSITSVRNSIANVFSKKQSCAVTCGNTCYYQSDLDDAVNQGYNLYQEGEEDEKDIRSRKWELPS